MLNYQLSMPWPKQERRISRLANNRPSAPATQFLLLFLVIAAGCATSSDEVTDVSESPDPPLSIPITTDCRPVKHVWNPDEEPLLLPCKATTEPCDGIDNDKDGFTDPHCPTIPCTFDWECTYGGLLPDADCNQHPLQADGTIAKGGVCNQIDGWPREDSHALCWGKLCPPTQKCVQGDCVTPGNGLPGAACGNGAECPLNSGCIPNDLGHESEPSPGVCKVFCHDLPCPEGFICEISTYYQAEDGSYYMSRVCFPECSDNIDWFDEVPAYACVFQLLGRSQSTSECINELYGLGDNCNQCLVDYVDCIISSCDASCAPSTADSCIECAHSNCGADFEQCSGWTLSDEPGAEREHN